MQKIHEPDLAADKPGRMYCSELNSDEVQAGSADRVDVWVLLEYRPVWRARALEDNDLSRPTRTWLDRSLQALANVGLKGRAQFVRQPEIDSPLT